MGSQKQSLQCKFQPFCPSHFLLCSPTVVYDLFSSTWLSMEEEYWTEQWIPAFRLLRRWMGRRELGRVINLNPSCFCRLSHLLHWRRYMRNFPSPVAAFTSRFLAAEWAHMSLSCLRGLWVQQDLLVECYCTVIFVLVEGSSAFGNAVCLQNFPSKGKLHFIMVSYLSWCIKNM